MVYFFIHWLYRNHRNVRKSVFFLLSEYGTKGLIQPDYSKIINKAELPMHSDWLAWMVVDCTCPCLVPFV